MRNEELRAGLAGGLAGSIGNALRTVLVLGRVSNLPTVWTNVMAGWFLTGGDWSGGLWWVMVGMSLLYVGGMTLNDAFDAEWDAEHAKQRPIPAGAVSVRSVWGMGWGQMLAGVLVAIFPGGVNGYCLLALVLAIVLYNWCHKRWKNASVVMGLCRFLVYVAAASAVVGEDGRIIVVIPFAMGLFVYVMGITIVARGESGGGKVEWFGRLVLFAPLLVGVVMLPMLSMLSPAGFSSGMGGFLLGMLAVAVFVLWLARALWQLRSTRPYQVGRFVSALLAGIILVDLIALSQVGSIFWPICGGLLLLTLLAQRWIPAT